MVERGPASDTTGPPQNGSSTPKVWQNPYLDQRPHSSLGYRTPKVFIAELAATTGLAAAREANTENRVDGEEDAASLPLQTTPSTPLQGRPAACVETT